MRISEFYAALQQGVLDGQENPNAIIASRNFYEVQTHLADSSHFFGYIVLVANKREFDGLSDEHQAAVRKAAAETIAWQRAQAATEDTASRQALIDAGMIFTPISDAVHAGLRELTLGELIRNVWPYVAVQYGVLMLCELFPGIVACLPRMLGY